MNGFVCNDCIPYTSSPQTAPDAGYEVDLDALTYLASINELSPGQVRSLTISAQTAYRMKTLVFSLIETACGTKLKSLECGLGIL